MLNFYYFVLGFVLTPAACVRIVANFVVSTRGRNLYNCFSYVIVHCVRGSFVTSARAFSAVRCGDLVEL